MTEAPTIAPQFEFDQEVAKGFISNRGSGGGLHDFLGFETTDVGPGTMHARLVVRNKSLIAFGNMHGGVLAASAQGTVTIMNPRK